MTSCKCIKVSRPSDGKPQMRDSEGVWRDANVGERVCVYFCPYKGDQNSSRKGCCVFVIVCQECFRAE